MKIKIIFLLIFFMVTDTAPFAQVPDEGNNNLPQIIPPSPDAASLGKYGEIPIGKYTGTANIEIPVYTINFDGLKIPISLTYHSGGIKVEELASWVGLGWSLNAGGIIAITVVGLPDQQANNGYLNHAYNDVEDILLLSTANQRSIGQEVQSGNFDVDPDLYSYNFIGYTGRFFIDKTNDKIYTIPKTNLKFNYPSWEVIDAAGFKYFFGNAESTSIENNRPGGNNTHTYSSTLVLTKIISPLGNEMIFSYQDYSSFYFTRGSQSKNIPVIRSGTGCDPDLMLKNNFSLNEIEGKRIHEITWSGGKVVFNKSADNREDIINDYSLDSIEVFNSQNILIKKTKLSYSFKESSEGISNFSSTFTDLVGGKRLFLDSVKEVMNGQEVSPYTFEYDSNLPYYLSPSQDHWGYYNGENNSSLLPIISYYNPLSGQSNAYGDANRNVNPTLVKAGSLKKIKYPTGGESEFKYEPNQALVSSCTYMNMFNPDIIDFDGALVTAAVNDGKQLDTLVVPSAFCLESKRKFEYDVYLPNVSNCSGSAKNCTGTLQVHLNNNGSAETIDLLVNPAVGNHVRGYALLEIGASYTLELDGTGPAIVGVTVSVAGTANPIFFDIEGNDFINTTVGGLRISSIINKSISQVPDTTQFYYYDRANILDTTLSNQKSSGRVSGIPRYFFESTQGCGTGGGGPNTTQYITLHSSSLVPVNSEDGKGIGYKMVEEIKKGNATKVRSVNTFTCDDDYPDAHYTDYPFIRSISFDYLKGLPLKDYKLKFNSASQTYSLLSEVSNVYTVSDQLENQIKGLRWACRLFGNFGGGVFPTCNEVFRLYKKYSKWFYLCSTTQKLYESSDTSKYIGTKSSYFYSDTNHLQMTRMELINSMGDTIQTDFKYPHDFSGTAPYAQMVNTKHIWSPVIEKIDSNITQNKELGRTKTNYQFWLADSLVLPVTVQKSIGGNSLNTEITFNGYDTTANLLQYVARDGVIHSYIWDYNKEFPIAEAVKADTNSIAYTSFEANGKGGWTFAGSTANDATSPTGKKIYTLTGSNNITKSSLSSGTTYIVSYWTKNSSAYSITGTISGFPVSGRTVNGWKYFEHHITGQTTITISGSGVIDELRLYPEKSLMTTYAYDPLIGMTSQCDANNRISYYEYDGFGRLVLIRDQDKNVIKKICYNYAGQPETCSPITYHSAAKSQSFTRNNCAAGAVGSVVTYTVAANTYSSFINQADADQKAQNDVNANGQNYANTNGTCIFSSVAKSDVFTRNNCAVGGTGSNVTYTVAAGAYTSTISQADADQKAQNDVNANGQNFANTNGTCTFLSIAKSGTFTRNNCPAGQTGSTVTYTVAAGTYSSTISQANADQLAQNDVNTNGQSFANATGVCRQTVNIEFENVITSIYEDEFMYYEMWDVTMRFYDQNFVSLELNADLNIKYKITSPFGNEFFIITAPANTSDYYLGNFQGAYFDAFSNYSLQFFLVETWW